MCASEQCGVSVKPAAAAGLTVFISYARTESHWASELATALEAQGFEILIDRRDIVPGEDWHRELSDFIARCDTVAWLVSPASMASTWCQWELEQVTHLSKRLIPLRVAACDVGNLPGLLASIQILPSEGLFSVERDLDRLVEVLKTDRQWVRQHTRLAERAALWSAGSRHESRLLRGHELREAESWAEARPMQVPAPQQAVMDLILQSRRAGTRRQRIIVGLALATAALSTTLAGLAVQQRNRAVEQRAAAQLNQSRYLVDLADRLQAQGDHMTALLVALEALPDARAADPLVSGRPYLDSAEVQLEVALRQHREVQVLVGHRGEVHAVAMTPDGSRVVTGSYDGTVRLWDGRAGTLQQTLRGHGDKVVAVAVSADGGTVFSAGLDGQ
ncbi:MAG: hypothetical protein C4K60_18650 [Ideonella sp. MAG2]|nr:MAG: hypothetical protein C4K60_18650 [Ideonella sp. MAG2]